MKIPFISATFGVVMITTAFKMDITIHNTPSKASQFEYKPFWADEFNKNGLPDAKKWGYDVGGSGWGNHELEYYTKDNLKNARVENGKLIIEAIKEPFEDKNYTSARLTSKGKADFLYGRFEVKAKLPKGLGTWPAIWMLATEHSYGQNYWPDNGEIDIMEHVGYDPNVIHASVHTKSYYHSIGTQKTAVKTIPTSMTEFHVYRIDWTPEKIDSYIDGELYFTFKNEKTGWKEWPFDKKQHILLNLAVGGDWGGQKGVDDSIFPQKFEIDYVRVYKMKK
ncbi:glycoside hydrolase family 16 protein [Arcicella sp. LKC2W]|uniref:glycoside hydrolase family 16 protein n=1 Tax=Arcicella sp. LKC2W TaxID=2984198 RepID=UPI002B215EE7|nr:glycoside hydrolase family 16 protein [Arcicella sp. LKC2W]MEA5459548.1 glycoside hydrolase family 16 protein [Arcicella sp. LKC2W]